MAQHTPILAVASSVSMKKVTIDGKESKVFDNLEAIDYTFRNGFQGYQAYINEADMHDLELMQAIANRCRDTDLKLIAHAPSTLSKQLAENENLNLSIKKLLQFEDEHLVVHHYDEKNDHDDTLAAMRYLSDRQITVCLENFFQKGSHLDGETSFLQYLELLRLAHDMNLRFIPVFDIPRLYVDWLDLSDGKKTTLVSTAFDTFQELQKPIILHLIDAQTSPDKGNWCAIGDEAGILPYETIFEELYKRQIPILMTVMEYEDSQNPIDSVPFLRKHHLAPVEPFMSPKLFISYSHNDDEFAKGLCEFLEQNGYDIWKDDKSIQWGERWPESIEQGIHDCQYFVFIMTPASLVSDYCMKELLTAIELEKTILPLRLEPVDRIPYLLKGLQFISCIETDRESFLEKLIISLQIKEKQRQIVEELDRGELLDDETIFANPRAFDELSHQDNIRFQASLELNEERIVTALKVYGHPVTSTAISYILQGFLSISEVNEHLQRLCRNRSATMQENARGETIYTLTDKGLYSSPPLREIGSTESLFRLAAEYYHLIGPNQIRWRRFEDLRYPLLEFDYRIRAKDFEEAASLVDELDLNHLSRWGYFDLVRELRLQLEGYLVDQSLAGINLGRIGNAYHNLGQHQDAIDYHQQALGILQGLDDEVGILENLLGLGVAYRTSKDIDESVPYLQQAIDKAQTIINDHSDQSYVAKAHQFRAFVNLGMTMRHKGSYAQAETYHLRAESLVDDLEDLDAKAYNLINMGVVYFEQARVKEAISLYREALEIAHKQTHKRRQIDALVNLGIAHRTISQHEKSVYRFFQEALEIAQATGQSRWEAICLDNLGVSFSDQGKYDLATEHINRSLAIAEDIKVDRTRGYALANLSRVYLRLGNDRRLLELAMTMAQEAYEQIAVYETKNLRDQQAWGVILAQICLRLDLHDESHDLLDRLQMLLEKIGDLDIEENKHHVLLLRGIVSIKTGEKALALQYFTEAERQADKVLQLTPKHSDAAYVCGLSQAGLAILASRQDEMRHLDRAEAMYYRAQANCPAAGIAQDARLLLETLKDCDEKNLLGDLEIITGQ